VGLAELLLSLVYVYPYRCQYCDHRFRSFYWGRRFSRRRRPEDRREYERIPVNFPARLAGLPGSALARVTSLSINGCTVATDVVLAHGAGVQLSFEAQLRARPILVEAAVVHATRTGAAGLIFVRMTPDQQQRLRRLVLELMATPPPANPQNLRKLGSQSDRAGT
jgi:hypothetical protein